MNASPPPWRASGTPQYATNGPAYIPVQARRNLNHHTPAENAQAKASNNESGKKRVEWPPGVRQYVQRCFVPECQVESITREELEAKLKQIITDAAESNNLSNVDWESLPLPQEMILNERKQKPTPASKQLGSNGLAASHYESQKKEDYSPKRKSTEISSTDDATGSIPPWRRTNSRNEFEDRANVPPTDKRRRIDIDNSSKFPSKLQHTLENRKRRFGDELGYRAGASHHDEPSGMDADQGPIIGRCQKLEKNYFRLTAPPNPDTVRPLSVLRKALDLLKKKWRSENNYNYVCDQFKSMRQDLTVQHIRNEFTASVYEIHARIALEKGDLGEYNQCQTQLQALYRMQLGGHPMEFKAYRILYFIYTRNQTAINDTLADLTPAEKADPAVKHALDVRSALALGNYHRFFKLYLDTPNMGAYLMDMFVDRERLTALSSICKAYKPDLNIRFITEELGFDSDEQSARFLLDYVAEEMLQEKPDGVKLTTGKTAIVFENARSQANRVIDIKGQI